MFSFDVDIKQLNKNLNSLGPKMAKKILNQSMRKGTKLVQRNAKQNAPRDTGKMARAITVRKSKTKSRDIIKFRVFVDHNKLPDGPYYPAFVEYGTKDRPPKPFMRKTFDETGEMARKLTEDEIRKLVDEAIKEANAK